MILFAILDNFGSILNFLSKYLSEDHEIYITVFITCNIIMKDLSHSDTKYPIKCMDDFYGHFNNKTYLSTLDDIEFQIIT